MTEETSVEFRDLYPFTRLVSNGVKCIVLASVALFIGHLSFGFPDYGIRQWHIFAIGFGGPLAIWITLTVEGWWVSKTLNLQEIGFTEERPWK